MNDPVPGNSPWAGHSRLKGALSDFSGDGEPAGEVSSISIKPGGLHV
jgi:hypothetical protein